MPISIAASHSPSALFAAATSRAAACGSKCTMPTVSTMCQPLAAASAARARRSSTSTTFGRPCRTWRARVRPGDARVGGHAAEAQHAGAQRAQHRREVAAIGVARHLRERRHLEGHAEELLWHGRAGMRTVDGDRDGRFARLARRRAGRRGSAGGQAQRQRKREQPAQSDAAASAPGRRSSSRAPACGRGWCRGRAHAATQ